MKDPGFRPLAKLQPLFATADLVFANLECPLSDQGGEVVKPWSPLVFNAPKEAVAALAPVHVVSNANNHVWDYGKAAAHETLDRLDAAGIAHVGVSREPGREPLPVVIERGGLRIGFVAFTSIWNQGPLEQHEARAFVAHDPDAVVARVLELAPTVDVVVVSHHGGEEYQPAPLPAVRALRRRLVEAGAHVVLGHHPHVAQPVEIHRGRPVFHSLGNLAMQMHSAHPETEHGILARIVFRAGGVERVEACVVEARGLEPQPVASREARVLVGRRLGLVFGDDGCAPVDTTRETAKLP